MSLAGTEQPPRASFAKSVYGSESDVVTMVRHRFDCVVCDSLVGQNLASAASYNRLTTRKIPCAKNLISQTLST
jgi:hypothetical protein